MSGSEFEKYQVSVSGAGSGARRLAPVLRARSEPPVCSFDGLEPGATYTVTVKTMSGKVTSWPATTDLTLSKYMPMSAGTSSRFERGYPCCFVTFPSQSLLRKYQDAKLSRSTLIKIEVL